MGKWVCPCMGCQKARKQAFEDILEMLYVDNALSHNAWQVKQRYLDEFTTKSNHK